ncbi:MAG: PIN domain-containing protein [Candidatus Cryosericum sp.]
MPIHSSLSLVIDTNIWIYLYHCGLVDAVFELGSLHVPDLMLTKELLTELSWQDLQGKGAAFDELTSDSMRTVVTLKDTTRGVSVCDVACLVLSEQMSIALVTHDKDLRKLAVKRHAPLQDFDGLLELMVTAGIINNSVRAAAIRTLIERHMRPR